MSRSYCCLLYHITFSTKERRPWLDASLRGRVHRYLAGAMRNEGATPLAVNGVADHVRLLAQMRQDKALSDFLRSIKANSSKWIHDTFPTHEGFQWQAGYAAFTVSQSQVGRVKRYIEEQEERHRRIPFEEELKALLRKHGIEYDERYLLS